MVLNDCFIYIKKLFLVVNNSNNLSLINIKAIYPNNFLHFHALSRMQKKSVNK